MTQWVKLLFEIPSSPIRVGLVWVLATPHFKIETPNRHWLYQVIEVNIPATGVKSHASWEDPKWTLLQHFYLNAQPGSNREEISNKKWGPVYTITGLLSSNIMVIKAKESLRHCRRSEGDSQWTLAKWFLLSSGHQGKSECRLSTGQECGITAKVPALMDALWYCKRMPLFVRNIHSSVQRWKGTRLRMNSSSAKKKSLQVVAVVAKLLLLLMWPVMDRPQGDFGVFSQSGWERSFGTRILGLRGTREELT